MPTTPAYTIVSDRIGIEQLRVHAHSSRRRPMVILSPRGSGVGSPYGVAPTDLAREVSGEADLFVLSSADVCWDLDDDMVLRTFGGAIRVLGTDPNRSQVLRTDRADAATVLRRVRYALRDVGGGNGTALVWESSTGSTAAPIAAANGVVDSSEQRAADAEAALEREKSARRRAEDLLAAAKAKIASLEAERVDESALFSDPEEQFRDEVTRAWLRSTPEADRGVFPLRDYVLGREFLDSLGTVPAPRAKVVGVVVDVLTRRAYDIPARQVHPQGRGAAATVTGQLVRDDGAGGYRCHIRTATANAPRLLWWECVDGSVELARAASHDDPMPL